VSYLWHGTTYTTGGAKTWVGTNAAGCDSTVTLNLTINTGTYNSNSEISCDSFEWHGTTYSASGVYTYGYSNANGCSSVDTMYLTINASTSSTESASVCESSLPYIWHTMDYNSSGVYTYHTNNAAGCDSTVTLNLTVNTGTYNSNSEISCVSFEWHGTTYTESGVYTYGYSNANGCSSVDTMYLTINASTSSTESASVCESSLPYVWNTMDYDSSGTYTYHTLNANGCDSVATLVLTVNVATSSTTNTSRCYNTMPYYWNGGVYSSTGTYVRTIQNAAGCDSVATLVLTVSTATPAMPTAITQTLVDNTCGKRVYRYTVTTPTPFAYGYTWTLPGSVGGVSGVTLDSGDASSSRVIRVKYASNAAALTSDSIKVRGWSGCGNSATKGFKLTNAAWAPLAAPAITTTKLVLNQCGARRVRYSVPVAATTAGAVGYEWSFVGGVLGSNAHIDSGFADSRVITVLYTDNAASNTTDSVRFRYNYSSGCSYGAYVKGLIALSALTTPAKPTAVTATTVVANVCGARRVRYTATAMPLAGLSVAAATGYKWSFTGSGLHSSANNYTVDSMDIDGLDSSRVIVVTYTSNAASAASDSVLCQYYSACGLGAYNKAKNPLVALAQPAAPTAVTATAVVTNVCGGRKVRYSVPALISSTATAARATSYNWSFVGSVLHATQNVTYRIDSMNVNGLDSSRVIVVQYLNDVAAGTDSVRCAYNSACGTGAVAKVKVPLLAALAQPAAPTAVTATAVVTTVCYGRKVRYSVPALIAPTATAAGAAGYSWSFGGSVLHATLGTSYVIDSMNVNGLDSSRVIVVRYLLNVAAGTDSVRCAYRSACGTGAVAKVKVPLLTGLSNCPPISGNIPVSKAPSVVTPIESMSVKLFPNPTTSNFNLQVVTAGKEEVTARVLDIQGRFIQSVKVAPNQTLSLGSALKAGAYFIEVRQGKEVKTTRVMKF